MGHQLRPHHDDQHDEHGHDHDDQHEQDHDHGSGWARVVHSVTQLFGGHCHDSADQVGPRLLSAAADLLDRQQAVLEAFHHTRRSVQHPSGLDAEMLVDAAGAFEALHEIEQRAIGSTTP